MDGFVAVLRTYFFKIVSNSCFAFGFCFQKKQRNLILPASTLWEEFLFLKKPLLLLALIYPLSNPNDIKIVILLQTLHPNQRLLTLRARRFLYESAFMKFNNKLRDQPLFTADST